MTLDDLPGLAVLGLCLRELRAGNRMLLDAVRDGFRELRADLRAYVGPAPEGAGRAVEPGGGVGPAAIRDRDGGEDQRQGVEGVGEAVDELARTQEEAPAVGVAQQERGVLIRGHRGGYRRGA